MSRDDPYRPAARRTRSERRNAGHRLGHRARAAGDRELIAGCDKRLWVSPDQSPVIATRRAARSAARWTIRGELGGFRSYAGRRRSRSRCRRSGPMNPRSDFGEPRTGDRSGRSRCPDARMIAWAIRRHERHFSGQPGPLGVRWAAPRGKGALRGTAPESPIPWSLASAAGGGQIFVRLGSSTGISVAFGLGSRMQGHPHPTAEPPKPGRGGATVVGSGCCGIHRHIRRLRLNQAVAGLGRDRSESGTQRHLPEPAEGPSVSHASPTVGCTCRVLWQIPSVYKEESRSWPLKGPAGTAESRWRPLTSSAP